MCKTSMHLLHLDVLDLGFVASLNLIYSLKFPLLKIRSLTRELRQFRPQIDEPYLGYQSNKKALES